jgi:PST family polysaccharide transporter
MTLREKVLRGGVYLAVRQGLGIAISGVGIILLTRAIGPEAYGVYAAAFGIYTYLFIVCQLGTEVYLIRRKEEPQPQDYHQAFSLLLLLSVVGATLAILALPFLVRWVQIEGFGPVAVAMFALLSVSLVHLTPLARLERALDYRRIGLIELSSQVAIYVVALPLAYQELGPWAPVGGRWASQLLSLILLYQASGYRPRLYWEPARVRAMVGYGLGVSSSGWLWHMRDLVNPLVVGRYAGADAVGYVALAIRLVEQISSIIMWTSNRLSVATFARLQEDRTRLARAVSEGMNLVLVTVGPLLAGFGLIAPWILPLLFGSQWLPALEVYPFIAVSYLGGGASYLVSSALYVLRRIRVVAFAFLVQLLLFGGTAFLLVPYLGLRGYGWAEVMSLASSIVVIVWFQLHVSKLKYVQAGVWFMAWAIPLFSWQLGPWVWVSPILPLVWPVTRRELLQAIAMVLRRTHRS